MNRNSPESNGVPDLRNIEVKPKTHPMHDVSFNSPEVNDYTTDPNIPKQNPIAPKSIRERAGNIKHKIAASPFKGVLSATQLIGGSIFLAFFINHFIFQSYQVFGLSMIPTLRDGDRLIISKIEKSVSRVSNDKYVPNRGEIVVFKNPRNPESPQLIKRVVGLPGERVVVENGNITIFNKTNPDGFLPDRLFGLELGVTAGRVDITVPRDHFFISGDNRRQGGSLDSRNELGTVPLEMIVGNLVLRIIPISNAQAF